jgi:hypothetical protein
MYRWLVTFLVAFFLNVLWENAHRSLYTAFRGGPITTALLLFMASKDALLICILIAISTFIPALKQQGLLFIVCAGFFIALCVEWHALATHRWTYSKQMPIIPLLQTGLTPTLQLGSLGAMSYLIFLSL